MDSSQLRSGSSTTTLAGLHSKGLRFSTFIDIGCADGNYFVDHFEMGLLSNTKPLHIDANPLYENSLREIKDVLGGEYVIAAVSDEAGEIEFTSSVHPYWSSARPQNDPYWTRLNGLHSEVTKIRALTLDDIVASTKLKGPFLLKMDVQGSEEKVLKGARATLRETDVVIVETDIDDFQAINSALVAADFSLFDLTGPAWLPDAALGWFYPVYLNNRRSDMKPREFWGKKENEKIINQQVERRKGLLAGNAFKLSKFRAMFPKK